MRHTTINIDIVGEYILKTAIDEFLRNNYKCSSLKTKIVYLNECNTLLKKFNLDTYIIENGKLLKFESIPF